MARTQEQVEADLASIRAARARPEGYVHFSDRAVTYRSIADLDLIERSLERELGQVQNTSRPRQTLIVASKGF
jgi:hypothetical protein